MAVDTVAVCLVVLPLAVVDVAVSVNESSFTVGFVVAPPTFIHGTVGPNLTAFSLSDVSTLNPFSVVLRVVFQLDHGTVLSHKVPVIWFFVIVELSELFSDLLNLGVVVVVGDLDAIRVVVTMAHSHIHLCYANFLSGQVASYRCLHLDDESELLHGDSAS